MKAAKIRLLEPSFDGYTGILCGVQFEDGVSVSELPFLEQQRICASMRAETINGENVSPSAAYSKRNKLVADKIVEVEAPEPEKFRRGDVVEEKKIQHFTRAELEAIADEQGIAGLRIIGNQFGVKAKGIVEMIEGVLKAQGGE